MRVAFNTRLAGNTRAEINFLTEEIFPRISGDHPQHNFLFISDEPTLKKPAGASQTRFLSAKPRSGNALLSRFWFDIKIPALLKKFKTDIFISPENNCSLTSTVPQIIITLQADELKRSGKFYRKTASVITGSEFSKQILMDRHRLSNEKIKVIRPGANEIFQPYIANHKDQVKKKFSEGKEYFLLTGSLPENEFISILKSFSQFKKRQQSGMKLIVALNKKMSNFSKSLDRYKYRGDVIQVDPASKEELAGLISSAYALIYFARREDFPFRVLEAFQCGVPVISIDHPVVSEIAGDAILYTSAGDIKNMGEKMIRLYTDENLWSKLVEKGKKKVMLNSSQEFADQLWKHILLTGSVANG